MNLEGHPDQPEWLSHVNASVLKVKLATAIIGISSIHLLKTFINAANYSEKVLMWQTIIHIAFLLSAMAIAFTDRLMAGPPTTTERRRSDPARQSDAIGERDQQRRYPTARSLRVDAIAARPRRAPATSEPPSTPSLSCVS